MEPSVFNYQGLIEQRDNGAYDNFLRSNIDNEQDRRNFNTEDGKDHLPFRTYEGAKNDAGESTIKHRMVPATAQATGVTEAGNYIRLFPGKPHTTPMRWNNPHSSELEVNIWVMNKNAPYVIPIKKPACSGEGYQDNVFTMTVPTDFNDVASCRQVGDCVLQIYAHSVESRMYSSGTPVIVDGGSGKWNPSLNDPTGIREAEVDVAWGLGGLRRLCLPSSSPETNWDKSYVYKARLSSDVYNHAYQNSDFSPYAGQQPQYISQNMQASCILKMAVGNFGELGKEYMHKTAREARDYAGKLDKKARGLIRNYETVTNAIIEAIKYKEKNTDALEAEVPAQLEYKECTKWRDQYQNGGYAGLGRERGDDSNGGYCELADTCLCHHDCWGEHNDKPDAYCARLEEGVDNRERVIKTMVDGSEKPRYGYSVQKTETCARCAEVGSTVVNRQQTNTYVPSFEIHGGDSVNMALQYIAPMMLKSGFLTNPHTGLISKTGDDSAILQIYMGVLADMWPEFKNASTGAYLEYKYPHTYNKIKDNGPEALEKYKFTYRGPVLKSTLATLADGNGGVDHAFKKLDADGNQDKGYYSAAKAWGLQNRVDGSSTAQPLTRGPLNAVLFPPQSAHHDQNKSPCDNAADGGPCTSATPFTMPPLPTVDSENGCFSSALTEALDPLSAYSTAQKDMDALNYDAVCESDTFIQNMMDEHDKLCDTARAEDFEYECPPYPEPDCSIPGELGKKPGQAFTNDDMDDVDWMNAAPSVLPSVSFFLALLSGFISLF